jgi:hypothetical protein
MVLDVLAERGFRTTFMKKNTERMVKRINPMTGVVEEYETVITHVFKVKFKSTVLRHDPDTDFK